jgi:hypothetical protein
MLLFIGVCLGLVVVALLSTHQRPRALAPALSREDRELLGRVGLQDGGGSWWVHRLPLPSISFKRSDERTPFHRLWLCQRTDHPQRRGIATDSVHVHAWGEGREPLVGQAHPEVSLPAGTVPGLYVEVFLEVHEDGARRRVDPGAEATRSVVALLGPDVLSLLEKLPEGQVDLDTEPGNGFSVSVSWSATRGLLPLEDAFALIVRLDARLR